MPWVVDDREAQSYQISRDNKHITVREFEHSWGQNSIIVRFHPKSDKHEDEPVVIIGAHQDSTNQWPFLPAP
jgi:leucyl aminopeptidase